jgi:hypothetical protein
MNPNHKPNWLENAPPECVEYWERRFLDEISYHNQTVAQFGKHLTEAEIAEEFTNDYQLSTLSKIEKLLTVPEALPLWKKISELKVNPFHFIIAFQLALNGKITVEHSQQHSDYAEKVEKQTNELLATLENSYLFNSLIPNLEPIFERVRYLQTVHENERKIVKPQTKTTAIDATYFRKSLTDFFQEWTQSARHNLVTIAFNVAFSEKITPETIKKKTNRRQRKQTVSRF